MLTNLLVCAIHPKLRPLVFSVGVLACVPALAIFLFRLAVAQNSTQAAVAGLMLSGSALAAMTHATILVAVTTDRRRLLWLADGLLILGALIGLTGVALGITQ